MQTEHRRLFPDEVAVMVQRDSVNPNAVKIDPQELKLRMDQAHRDISHGQAPENSCLGCLMGIVDPLGIIIERKIEVQFDRYQQATIRNLNTAVEIVNAELPIKAQEKRDFVQGFHMQGDSEKILDANGWHILGNEIVSLPEDKKVVFISGSALENHHDYDRRIDILISDTGEVFLASLASSHTRRSYNEVNYTSSLQRHLCSGTFAEKELFKAKLAEAYHRPGARVSFSNPTRQHTHVLVVSKFSSEDPSHLKLVSQVLKSAKVNSFESAYEDGCVRQKKAALQRGIGI